MRFKLIQFLIFVSLFCSVFAQKKDEHCGTDRILNNLLKTDPTAAAKLRENRNKITSYLNSSVDRSNTDTIITVAVVVHVIHSGQPLDSGANISDTQIVSQITVLNQCFNKQNPDTDLVPNFYKSLIANVGIKFCLAMYDTAGKPTTGITRDSFLGHSYTPQAFDDNVKPYTQWDPTRYFNIWVTDLGGGGGGGDGVLGYSTMPELGIGGLDGIVVDYHYFGVASTPPFNLGKTAVHETGHWLGLYHPFYPYPNGSGCAGLTPETCDTAGDYICDTPPEAEATYGEPNDLQCTCYDTAYYHPGYDMWEVFMDYTNDDGLLMFTPDQAAEMRAVLNTLRLSIQNDTAAGSCKYAVVVDTMGIGFPQLSKDGMNVSLYPNPSDGVVNLQYSTIENSTLEIFNFMGEQIITQELPESQNSTRVFDLSAYPSGIYFIYLQSPHSQKTLKFSIVR